MAEPVTRRYRAALVCVGPDGEPECRTEIPGVCTDEGPNRSFEFDSYVCPVCGRTDGFSVSIFEELE